MAERLYLIRKNLEGFLGPFSHEEMRRSFRRMEFGLQDEVAASFREWVAFDDVERIKIHYPEISDFVRREMLGGWGVSRPPQKMGTQTPRATGDNNKKNSATLLFLILILAVLGVGAFWAWREGDIPARLFPQGYPNVDRAHTLLAEDRGNAFDAYIDRFRSEILSDAQSRASSFRDWIPYIRAYAFRREGRFEGLNPQLLRGIEAINAPRECSVSAFKKAWVKNDGEWTSFLNGTSLPGNDWMRLLTWDPAWIIRRSPQLGWVSPESYHEACLMMALKALGQISQEIKDPSETRDIVKARLQWLMQMVRGTASVQEVALSGSLWALSCLESSIAVEALNECRTSVEFAHDWDLLFRFRSNLTQARLVAARGPVLSARDLDDLRQVLGLLKPKDPYTRFEYDAELRFYQQLVINGGRVQKAAEYIKERFPDVNLSN